MEQHQDDSFTGLADFHVTAPASNAPRGNVIKARSVIKSITQQVTVEEGENGQPSLVIHRTGDAVTSVEIACSCGRTTTIDLTYGEE